jgi:hypothetical protein
LTHVEIFGLAASHIPGTELRWGETFADVTPFLTEVPVPAPASLGLLVLSVLGVAATRRRQAGQLRNGH